MVEPKWARLSISSSIKNRLDKSLVLLDPDPYPLIMGLTKSKTYCPICINSWM